MHQTLANTPTPAAQTVTQTIKCTQANAADFQQLVKTDPELLALVQSLQAQNMFPGLRAMQITLTGAPEQVAQGLAPLIAKNAATAQTQAAVGQQTGAATC